MIVVHNIRDESKRRKLLLEARDQGPQKSKQLKTVIKIEEAFKRQIERDTASNQVVFPTVAAKPGSTKSYPRYNIDKEAIILAFIENLTSFDGGKRSIAEARQIAADVSKYLAFCNRVSCTWESLVNRDKMKQYITKLEKDKIGVDGILTKIDRLQTAFNFAVREKCLNLTSQQFATISDQISQWKATYRKSKPSIQIEREMRTKIDPQALQKVQSFLENEAIQIKISEIIEKSTFSASDTNTLVAYLFCVLTYGNWQRPGAAINLTLKEALEAKFVDDKLVVHCLNHKTAGAYGPAVMVLKDHDAHVFQFYLNVVRPTLASSSTGDNELALVSCNGRPLHNYRDLVSSLTKQFGLKDLPNLTTIRKSGATAAVTSLNKDNMELLSSHMSHSSSTSERYYRHRQRDASAVTAFDQIQSISGELITQIVYKFSPFSLTL